MTPERIAEMDGRCKKATEGPWAWDQYGEKVNAFLVGVAIGKDGAACNGRVETERYDPDGNVFVEEVLWCTVLGQKEGATVNYDDAAFIAHARTDLPEAIEEIKRLRKKVDRVLSSAKSDAFCPCCQESEVCDPDCTFATDCPENWERMILAREALREEKGEAVLDDIREGETNA